MWEILQTPELERALLIAIIAGPTMGLLGTFITLRGMAFFSDAISHAALTGVGLGIALHWPTMCTDRDAGRADFLLLPGWIDDGLAF